MAAALRSDAQARGPRTRDRSVERRPDRSSRKWSRSTQRSRAPISRCCSSARLPSVGLHHARRAAGAARAAECRSFRCWCATAVTRRYGRSRACNGRTTHPSAGPEHDGRQCRRGDRAATTALMAVLDERANTSKGSDPMAIEEHRLQQPAVFRRCSPGAPWVASSTRFPSRRWGSSRARARRVANGVARGG